MQKAVSCELVLQKSGKGVKNMQGKYFVSLEVALAEGEQAENLIPAVQADQFGNVMQCNIIGKLLMRDICGKQCTGITIDVGCLSVRILSWTEPYFVPR